MERMDRTLYHFLGDNPSPLELSSSLPYMIDICEGLAFLHQSGVLHRDIKSQNILLGDGGAKVADFGLAHVCSTIGQTTGNASFLAEKAGTKFWMAPEVLGWGNSSFDSDVFSLHVVFWEIVENRQGGQGRAIGEVLLDRGPLAKLPINGEGAETDSARERLNKLIRSCGQLERERRPTIGHVLAALKDIYDSLCAPGGVEEPGATTRSTLQGSQMASELPRRPSDARRQGQERLASQSRGGSWEKWKSFDPSLVGAETQGGQEPGGAESGVGAVQPEGSQSQAEGSSAVPSASRVAVAKYEYVAQGPEQLSFQIGDIVQLHTEKMNAKGWGLGQANGKVGWFPGDFVDMRPSAAERENRLAGSSTSGASRNRGSHSHLQAGGAGGGGTGASTAAGGTTTTDTTSTATNSTANVSTAERAELAEFHRQQVGAVGGTSSVGSGPRPEEASGGGRAATAATGAPSAEADRQNSAGDIGLRQAVLAAAQELARSCQVPGISEAAGVLCIMANDKASDSRLRQCRSIVLALKRAEKVVGKGGDTTGETARVLIEDVHDAIFDLVELIKTFQSKNKFSKVFLSRLFKRRQEELDAVVDRAVSRLQLSLQLQVGHDMSSVRSSMRSVEEKVSAVKDGVKAVEA
ncbi:unnamed protein product, partial [Ectocarpus sp. 8 AP-2014]